MSSEKDVTLVWDAPPDLGEQTIHLVHKLAGLLNHPNPESLRLLDFGCGQGRYMDAYAQIIPQQQVFGVDVIVDDLHVSKARGFSCLEIGESGTVLPFADESFDIVFSSNVIEHIERIQYLKYLDEIHRVLVPNGKFVVATPNYPMKRFYDMKKAQETEFTRYYLFDDPTHINKLTFWQLENDLEKVFSRVYLTGSDFHFLQRWFKFLNGKRAKRRLRYFADKAVGYCIK